MENEIVVKERTCEEKLASAHDEINRWQKMYNKQLDDHRNEVQQLLEQIRSMKKEYDEKVSDLTDEIQSLRHVQRILTKPKKDDNAY